MIIVVKAVSFESMSACMQSILCLWSSSETASFVLALCLAALNFLWPRLPLSSRVFVEMLVRRVLFSWNPLFRHASSVYFDAWSYRHSRQVSGISYLGPDEFHTRWVNGAYSALLETPAGILYAAYVSPNPLVYTDVKLFCDWLMPDIVLILERDRRFLEDTSHRRAQNPDPDPQSFRLNANAQNPLPNGSLV
ncbi:hypothetical protein K435DRAFT_790081 [Dendrothele bispora CBS 962.96]|uniref:Uncharacterized protein n=1 Tax=Dendrothele bispora (strain CBS 962.96) TaxID=1314807 RepID=A0A4V4HI82_DENBC|nr:hypothetical protein K435DRAFT_790081 [Dendrothele bispora CBS 962.96]